MKLSRRVVSACVTGALLVSSLGISAFAIKSTGIDITKKNNLDKDFDWKETAYLEGYYQASNWFWRHNARAGTHFYGSGGLKYVDAVTFVYYVDKNGRTRRLTDEKTVKGDGWAETRWVEVPDSAITPYRVVFRGNWYYKNGNLTVNSLRVN